MELVYQVFYTKYQVPFYLRRIEPVLKRCEVPKYHDQNCLKDFLLLSEFPMMIHVSAKSAHLALKKLVLSDLTAF